MTNTRRQFQIALTGLFAALAFVLGRLHVMPNVEFVSFAVFTAGYAGGPAVGANSGAILAVLQIVFGGGASLLLAAAQVIGFASIGVCGSLFTRKLPPPGLLAVTGACLTIWYQFLVNSSLVPGSGLSARLVFEMGAPFAAVHVLSNTVVFELGRLLLLALERHPAIVGLRKAGHIGAARD